MVALGEGIVPLGLTKEVETGLELSEKLLNPSNTEPFEPLPSNSTFKRKVRRQLNVAAFE